MGLRGCNNNSSSNSPMLSYSGNCLLHAIFRRWCALISKLQRLRLAATFPTVAISSLPRR